MSNIKVSIVVPVFNVEPWLPDCVESLINQSLKDIEIILIDDGCTDGSGKICDMFVKRDARVKVIHQENGGAAIARNAGLNIVTGEYIGFCDPDDYMDTDFFENLYLAAKKSDADIAKGKTVKHELGKIVLDFGPSHEKIRNNRAYFASSFGTGIYRNRFLKKYSIDFPAGVITAQDIVFLTKAILLANKIELVDNNSYYHYIRREDSLDSDSLSNAKVLSKITAVTMIIDFINNIQIDSTNYNIIFSMRLNHLIENVFERTNSLDMRYILIKNIIQLYNICKFKDVYNKNNEIIGDLLSKQDETGLLFYLLERSKRRKITKLRFKLFGFIPILKIRYKNNSTIFRLFNLIPLIKISKKKKFSYIKLLGIFPIITIK